MTISDTKQSAILFLLAVFALFFNFFDHRLSTLSTERFLDNEFPSERYVISRLAHNLDHGTEDAGGFMLAYGSADALHYATQKEDYRAFKESLPQKNYSIYLSHLGFQDNLYFPIWQGLSKVKAHILETAREGSRWHKRMTNDDIFYFFTVTQGLVALLGAIVLSLIVLWAAREFGTYAGWVLLGAILIFMPALAFFGKSLWWSMYAWFIPLAVSLWAYRLNKGQPLKLLPLFLASACIGAGVLLRGSMGYEYISTIGIAAAIPPLFYALLNRWPLKTWIAQSIVIGLFALSGLAAALYLHWHALESAGYDPLAVIMEKYQVRASGGEYAITDSKAILESTKVAFPLVLLEYLYAPQKIAIPQILLLSPFLFWLYRYIRHDRAVMEDSSVRLYDALCGAIGLGFIGACSMLLLLKGHAVIHGFDIVIWNVPMNIFLALFYGQWIKDTFHNRA